MKDFLKLKIWFLMSVPVGLGMILTAPSLKASPEFADTNWVWGEAEELRARLIVRSKTTKEMELQSRELDSLLKDRSTCRMELRTKGFPQGCILFVERLHDMGEMTGALVSDLRKKLDQICESVAVGHHPHRREVKVSSRMPNGPCRTLILSQNKKLAYASLETDPWSAIAKVFERDQINPPSGQRIISAKAKPRLPLH